MKDSASPPRADSPLPAPADQQLEAVFEQKYGSGDKLGWGPRLRKSFGYYNPDDQFEAVVAGLVSADTRWLDVGCGRDLFPNNRTLARELANRCAHLAGVDPDQTLTENPFIHEAVLVDMADYSAAQPFDLVTMRMVAEHVADPQRVVASLARNLKPGGLALVYTVNGRSPMPLLTRFWPLWLRHPMKRFLWRTEAKDTFPTCFRMNTRRRLEQLMAAAGFSEQLFLYLDDCRTFGRFRVTLAAELSLRAALKWVGLRYPENCLLGVYRRCD